MRSDENICRVDVQVQVLVLLVIQVCPFMQFRYFIRSDENICRVDVQVQVLGVDRYSGPHFHTIHVFIVVFL